MHVVGDALASIGVILALTAIYFFEILLINPIVAIFISILLLKEGITVAWDAIRLLLQECPLMSVRQNHIYQRCPVLDVEGMYFWELYSHVRIGNLHVVTDLAEIQNTQEVYEEIKDMLRKKFDVRNVTVQFETAEMAINHSHTLHHKH